jgi:alpha,alpha-trehalase
MLALLAVCAGAHALGSSLFQELFVAVQSSQIFPDGKSFVDAVPNRRRISYSRNSGRNDPHRRSPGAIRRGTFHDAGRRDAAPSPPDQVPLGEHIDRLWDVLTRSTPTAPMYSSLLPLPQAYVVPGGRFREIYYWDSYFTMLGLGPAAGTI